MRKWPKDWDLTLRMFLTIFILGAVYLGFLVVLYYFGVGIVPLMAIAGIMMFVQYFFSSRLVLLSTGARKVSREQAPELYTIIERLCSISGLPMPAVAIVPSDVPNAFATGRNRRHAVVAVTQGLLRRLNTDELSAVLAHELSHVKNMDMAVMTIASFLSTVAYFFISSFIFGMRGDRRNAGGTVFVYIVSLIVYAVSFMLVRLLSRYRELAADRGSAIITGRPSTLISALLKISGQMDRMPKQDLRATEGLNQFYIVPALTGESIMELFSTHPSLQKRIKLLERMERALGY